MQIFSYVVRHDCGFAPNPFGGVLTLATCKPQIRRCARTGDWIIGTGSVATVGRQKLVYAAQIAAVIPIDEYGKSRKYIDKRPSSRSPWWRKCGDNIYVKVKGRWKHRSNPHHDRDAMARDVSGKNVLICKSFWYFGDAAVTLPSELHELIKKGPGHKRFRDVVLLQRFLDWLRSMPNGRHGRPFTAPDTPTLRNGWRTACDSKKRVTRAAKGCHVQELDWGKPMGKEAW